MGATENAAAVKNLLTGLRDRGLPTDQQYLFVIDGAKALRAGIEEVFGSDQPVQRCRHHKMRNVLDELPREQHAQVSNVMRATWKLTDCDEGMKRLEGLARFLEHDYESVASRLWEGKGRDVHDAEAEASASVVQVPGYDQRYRDSAEWCSDSHE